MNRKNIVTIVLVFILILLAILTTDIQEYFTQKTLEQNIANALTTQLRGVTSHTSSYLTLPGNKYGILVHERDLYVLPGQNPIELDSTEKTIANIYNPFGNAMPTVKTGMTRMYRLYTVYTDDISQTPEIELSLCNGSWGNCGENNADKKIFKLTKTWGGIGQGPLDWHRDAYTELKPASEFKSNHSTLKGRVINPDGFSNKAVIRKVVLQAFDVLQQ
jgi:hypothetical protein